MEALKTRVLYNPNAGKLVFNDYKETFYTIPVNKVEELLRSCLDFDAYDVKENNINPFQPLAKIFKSEYGWEVERKGRKIEVVSEWLQGLPSCLTVPFYYNDIINFLKATETNDFFEELTEDQKQDVLNNWFYVCAYVLCEKCVYLF